MKIKDFTICTVRKILDGKGYMFVRNGDTLDIMCHIRQGANHLTVTPEGECIEHGWVNTLPTEGDKIALVRESNDPNSGRHYTHAKLWVPYRILEGARFALERMNPINKVAVRALAVSHRVGSHFTNEPTQVLFEGTVDELHLLAEADLWPLRGNHSTTLNAAGGKSLLLSHNTKWEVKRDGKWTNCGSLVAQTGLIDKQAIKKLLPK